MTDTRTILVGAAGVIIGALITQVAAAINNYFSDKRKYNSEQRQALLIRKITIGEEFYALNGLAIQSLKKTLHYLETKDSLRNEDAVKYLEQCIIDRNNYLKSILQREKAHTAISLYYDIKTSFESSQDFENSYTEFVTRIKDIDAQSPDALQSYINLNNQMINLLRSNILMIENDRKTIENEIKRIMDQFFN